MIQLKCRKETEIITRKREIQNKQDQLQTVEEIVEITKLYYPVRQQVLDRKQWPKFGEVSSFKRGENKQGDIFREKPLQIESADNSEKFEIDIVKKIQNLDTGDIKLQIGQQKHKDNMSNLKGDDKKNEQSKEEKQKQREEIFNQLKQDSNLTIKIQDVAVENNEVEETKFKEFISNILKSNFAVDFNNPDFKQFRIKVSRTKGQDKALIRAFLEFYETEKFKIIKRYANRAYEILSQEVSYNHCVLNISWAQPAKPREERTQNNNNRNKK